MEHGEERSPNGSLSIPQGFRRESRPFGKRGEFRPTNLRMHPASHAAVGSAHHILAPDDTRPVDEAPRDELGMLHDVRGMTYHARHQDRAGRELNLFPDTHLVLVPDVCRLEGVGLCLHPERDVDDVLEGDVVDMRAVPAAPAPVIAHFLRRDAGEGMVSASIRRITYFR